MAEDKKLKFSVAVDDPSFRKSINMVRELTNEVSKLAEATKRAATGGIGGVQVSSKGGGTFNAASAAVTSGARTGGMGGIAGILTQGLTADKNFFKSIASSSKEALDAIKNNLKNSVNEQGRAIDELTQKMQGLGRTYDMMKNKGRLTPELAQSLETSIGGQAVQLGGMRKAMGQQQAALGAAEAAGGGGAVSSFLRGGVSMGGLGMAAGGVMAVAGLVGMGMKAYSQNVIAGSEDFMTRRTMLGSTFGNIALGMKRGDTTFLAGLREAYLHDPQIMAGLAAQAQAKQTGVIGGALTSPMGIVKDSVGELLGGGGLGMARAYDMADTETRLRLAQAARQEIESNPMKFFHLQMLQEQYGSRLGNMRALGMGWGRKLVQGPGGNIWQNRPAFDDYLQRFRERGIDEGQVVAMHQAIEAVAGRGTAQRLGGLGVSAQLGGMTNAAQILGQGAMYSTVGGAGFMRSIMNTIGRGTGGIDVAAGNRMGALVAAGLAEGGPLTSGLGFAGALGAFARGVNPAQDMRIQAQLAAGVGQMGGLFQGTRDPFQQGLNTLNAIAAAPGASIYGQDYLATRMTPRLMADILGGKDAVPRELLDRGISREAVRQYASETMKGVMFRYIDTGKGTAEDVFAGKMRATGGDIRDYYRQGISGIRGKEARGEFTKDTIRMYAEVLEDTGMATDSESAKGMARAMMGLGAAGDTRRQRGRGVGDPGAGTVEQEQAKASVQLQRDFNDQLAASAPQLKEMLRAVGPMAGRINAFGQNLGQSADELNRAFRELTETVRVFSEESDKSGTLRAQHIAQEAGSKAAYEAAMSSPVNRLPSGLTPRGRELEKAFQRGKRTTSELYETATKRH